MIELNWIGLVVLGALVGQYALEQSAALLNLRALRPEVPAEFHGLYDPATYARSQEYTRVRTRFGLVRGAIGLVMLLAFWWAGGFNAVDRIVRAAGTGTVMSGALYIGALGLLSTILGLPFRMYSTFVIEERFGFNRTGGRTFWLDVAKELLLAVALGLPLLVAILFLFEWAGAHAWLWCWAAASAFVVGVQFVAPAWILPLFNKYRPLESGELREAILSYARSVAFPLEGIFVMDGSRRSSKGNAFFVGFGRHKRVALFDTLLGKQGGPELVAIVAHEVGHFKRRHIQQGMAIAFVHTGVIFWLLSVVVDYAPLYEAFYIEEPSIYTGLVLFGLIVGPVELPLSILVQALSRRNEFQADAFAARTTGRPDSLVGALKKLSVDSLTNLTPHPFHVWLHYSHPPLLERIAALRPSPAIDNR